MADETLRNTSGTMSTNIIFKNKSPIGFTIAAPSPKIKPQIPPITIPIIKQIVKA